MEEDSACFVSRILGYRQLPWSALVARKDAGLQSRQPDNMRNVAAVSVSDGMQLETGIWQAGIASQWKWI